MTELLDEAADFGELPNRRPAGTVWAGIDPGKKGYVAALIPDGTIQSWPTPLLDDGKTYDLPRVRGICMEMLTLDVRHVQVETQQPTRMPPGADGARMANNAVRSSFMLGYGFALWEMALTCVGLPYDCVTPTVWKNAMGVRVSGIKDWKAKEKAKKQKAVQMVQRLFPHHELRRNPNHHSSKPSPDQAEAILLAIYGRQKHGR